MERPLRRVRPRPCTALAPIVAALACVATAPLAAQLPATPAESAAAALGAAFRDLGLAPAGDTGSFVRTFTVRRVATDPTSFVMVMGRGAHGHWLLGRDALLASGTPPARPVTGPAILVVGAPADTAALGGLPLAGAVVIQVVRRAQTLDTTALVAAAAAGARAWIEVTDISDSAFSALARAGAGPHVEVESAAAGGAAPIPVFAVRARAAAEVLRAAGEDVAALLAEDAPTQARVLPGFTGTVDLFRTSADVPASVVIATLAGGDPRLREERVLIAGPGGRMLALARALSRPDVGPRRSLVFVAAPDSEDPWLPAALARDSLVPGDTIAASVDVGPADGPDRGVVLASGMPDSSLRPLADSVAAAHPELGLRLLDAASDRAWPAASGPLVGRAALLRFAPPGPAPDSGAAGPPAGADAGDSLIALVYYLELRLAEATGRPAWDAPRESTAANP